MRTVLKALGVLALLPGSVFAAKGPEIQVMDGKISVAAEGVPLGRFLNLWDKAMGTTSQVKPDLANRNISIQFTGLEFDDAVRKVFQGQPYNYSVVGRTIRVLDLAVAGTSTTSSAATLSPFPEPPPIMTSPLMQPLPAPIAQQPVQGGVPGQNPNAQPGPINTLFGPRPDPNAQQPPSTAPMVGPGGVAPIAITPLGGGAPSPPTLPGGGAPAPAVGPLSR